MHGVKGRSASRDLNSGLILAEAINISYINLNQLIHYIKTIYSLLKSLKIMVVDWADQRAQLSNANLMYMVTFRPYLLLWGHSYIQYSDVENQNEWLWLWLHFPCLLVDVVNVVIQVTQKKLACVPVFGLFKFAVSMYGKIWQNSGHRVVKVVYNAINTPS